MGRAHLSTRYGIDDAPRRKSPIPEPPRYVDRPFDLDADADAPDVVYEAFLTPEQLRWQQNSASDRVFVPPRESAPSPVESIESDGASSDATTQPSTRVPSPVRDHDRIMSDTPPRADSTADRGLRVLTLLEPLTAAREAASPAIQAAIEAGVIDCPALVLRLTTILRPHISAALAPYLAEVPEVEFLGHMFERSIILDILGTDGMTSLSSGFPRTDILAALDVAEEAMYVSARTQDMAVSVMEDDALSVEEELDADPGSDELLADADANDVGPTSTSSADTSHASSQNWWGDRNWAATPPLVSPTTLHNRTATLAMDVDTDDDARSNSSSSAASSARGPSATFAPRVFRARDLVLGPRPSVQVLPIHDPFLAMNHYRTPSPLR